VTVERDELAAKLQVQDAEVWNQSQELAAKSALVPTSFTETASALRGLLPSVASAPGFAALLSASDAKQFAAGIHSLIQTARFVGRREVLDTTREDAD
jgi:hypothetical protein